MQKALWTSESCYLLPIVYNVLQIFKTRTWYQIKILNMLDLYLIKESSILSTFNDTFAFNLKLLKLFYSLLITIKRFD